MMKDPVIGLEHWTLYIYRVQWSDSVVEQVEENSF